MDVNSIANQLASIRSKYQGSGAAGGDMAYQAMADFARSSGLDSVQGRELIAQAANQIAPGTWSGDRVGSIMNDYPGYGLGGAMTTLNNGGAAATQRIDDTQKMVGGLYDKGLAQLAPYQQAGQQANDLQLAYLGLLGPEKQAEAFANYQQSPGTQFLVSEGERALTRNAAATGGLSGGNVLRDLMQFGTGVAMQDYNNQYNRLGETANRGYGAATTGAGLYGQQAGVQAGLGQYAASIPMQIASQQAQMQYGAGQNIAMNIGNTSSALANLVNQQGAGMSDILGNYTNNINSLMQGAAAGDAASKEQLATILANLGVNAGSQSSSLPYIPGQQTNMLGTLGNIASGLGGLYYGLNSGKSPAVA